jgi:hypothetical protein
VGLVTRKMAAAAAAAAAAVAARRAVELGWKLSTGKEPPTAKDLSGDGDTELRDLLLWSVVVAGAVVIARRIAVSTTEDLLGASEED